MSTKRHPLLLLGADYTNLEVRAMTQLVEAIQPAEGQKKLDPAEEAAARLDGTYNDTPLDQLVSQMGLVRMPGESDEALRARAKHFFNGGK